MSDGKDLPRGSEVRAAASTYSAAIADANRYTEWILELFGSSICGRICEIGLGHGSYAKYLMKFGGYVGVDIDPAAVEEARQQISSICENIARFCPLDILDSAAIASLGTGSFDTLLCANVLEHIADHRTAVENMLSLLRPGGRLLIFVPAHQALYGSLDRLAGHERRYSKRAIQVLFEGLPATLDRVDYVNPIGGLGWWLNKGAQHNDLNSAAVNAQIRLFEKYALPVSKALTPVTKRIFGQSLVVDAKRL